MSAWRNAAFEKTDFEDRYMRHYTRLHLISALTGIVLLSCSTAATDRDYTVTDASARTGPVDSVEDASTERGNQNVIEAEDTTGSTRGSEPTNPGSGDLGPTTDSAALAPPSAGPDTPADKKTLRDGVQYSSGFFTNRSDALVGNGNKLRYGVAVTDVNLDGDFEAVVAGYSGANEVWNWNGEAVEDIAPDSVADASRKAIGVAACDVDGDGSEEIYFLNIDQFGGLGSVADRLWRRTSSDWEDVFERPENEGQINTFSGRSVACLDRTGDGVYGVFVANYGGPMKLFEWNDGALVDVAPSIGADLVTGGRALVNVPLDSPQMNLFAGNENGANFFFVGDGTGLVANEASMFGITDATYTVRGAAVLDADLDGDFDLVYGNWNGTHRLWLRNGKTFTLGTPADMAIPSKIRTVIAADFDNDGNEEIFWNNIDQPNRLFGRVNNEWITLDIGDALEPTGKGTGGAVLDFDGDGTLELLVSHGESGAQPMSMFIANAVGNHFVRIQPLTNTGGPARGATVTITQGETSQRRAIDAGSGYLCQMEPVAHFGLGKNSEVPVALVQWPDGTQVEALIPAIDGTYTVSRDGQWKLSGGTP